MIPVPSTREAAIAALVDLDVAKWGEAERAAAQRAHADLTYGLALNKLAHRPEYGFGDDVPELVAAARAALTSDDRHLLGMGV